MQIIRKGVVSFLVIVILLAAAIALIGQNYVVRQNLAIAENTIESYQYNEKILSFSKLFVTKVLKTEGDVSFEDRLKLENAIRDINDKAIFDQWQEFVNSESQIQAQIAVKDLLELLITKIQY